MAELTNEADIEESERGKMQLEAYEGEMEEIRERMRIDASRLAELTELYKTLFANCYEETDGTKAEIDEALVSAERLFEVVHKETDNVLEALSPIYSEQSPRSPRGTRNPQEVHKAVEKMSIGGAAIIAPGGK